MSKRTYRFRVETSTMAMIQITGKALYSPPLIIYIAETEFEESTRSCGCTPIYHRDNNDVQQSKSIVITRSVEISSMDRTEKGFIL